MNTRNTRRVLWVTLLLSLLCGRPWAVRAAGPAEIKAAIGRGVQYLRSQQAADGTFRDAHGSRLGGVALAGLALRASEVPAEDPAVERAAGFVRANAPRDYQTYDVALSILLLDRMTREQSNQQEVRSRSAVPASKKLRSGRVLSGSQVRDSELILELGKRLQAGQGPSGTWSYDLRQPSDGDHSNTQFGVLGLWIACQHGLEGVDGLKRCAAHFRGCQSQEGGWGYVHMNFGGAQFPGGFGGLMPGMPGIGNVIGGETPSMTCAGLIALATDLGMRTQFTTAPARGRHVQQQQGDPQVEKAMRLLERYLQGRAGAAGGLGMGMGIGMGNTSDLYFFWSLERVGVFYGKSKIGETDWYQWGAERLLDPNSGGQQPGGNWQGVYSPLVDTSFALLFLSRANVSPELTDALAAQFGDSPHAVRSYRPGEMPAPQPSPAGQGGTAELPTPEVTPPQTPPQDWAGQTTPALLAALEGSKDLDARKTILAELAKRRPTYAEVENQLAAIQRFLASADRDAAAAARDQMENAFQRAPMSHCLYWLGKADEPLKSLIWAQVGGRISRADPAVRSGYRDVAVKVLEHEQFSAAGKAAALELLGRLKDRSATGELIRLLPVLPSELRPKANELLREWTGEDYGPRPGDGAAEIAAAVQKWRSWWRQNGGAP